MPLDIPAPVANTGQNPLSTLGQIQSIQGQSISNKQAALNLETSQATQPAHIQGAIATGQNLATGADTAKLANVRGHLSNLMQSSMELIGDPNLSREKIVQHITDSAGMVNAPPAAVQAALQSLPPEGAPVADFQKYLVRGMLKAQDAVTQINATLPPTNWINNGQQNVPVPGGNPLATGAPQTAVQNTVPPTATEMGANGVPQYVGVRQNQGQGTAPIQAGPALGQEAGVLGGVAPNNAHYAQVQADAIAAPTRIGVLQNIKELAPQAVTGDQPAVRTLISKLAGYLGWQGDKQTPTDIMAKEAALLASKGGNTDLARTLNEAATPGGHMTKDAILQTADQLIGQEKSKIAAQQYFSGVPTNSPVYAQKLQAWSSAGDPRAFEYASKTPEEQARMKASMQKAGTWEQLRQNMIRLHSMGITPQ